MGAADRAAAPAGREPSEREITEAVARKRTELRNAGVNHRRRGERQMPDLEPAAKPENAQQLVPRRTAPGPVCSWCFGPTSVIHYAAPRGVGGEIPETVCDDPACEDERRREEEYDEWARGRNEFRVERLRRRSQLPGGFEGHTFDSFDPAGNPSLAAALETSKAYARSIRPWPGVRRERAADAGPRGSGSRAFEAPEPGQPESEVPPATPPGTPPGILLAGSVGVGKTHLAVAILTHAMRAHKVPALFVTVPRLLDEERERYGSSDDPGPQAPGPFEEAAKADLLVLDDLGAERITDWAREKLFTLVNHRYSHRLPTVATTNLEPEEMAEVLGARTFSRLAEMCEWIAVSGADHRLKRLASRRPPVSADGQ